MTERLWVFPAILSVLCALAFTEGLSILGMILLVLWVIRIYFLRHPTIFKISILIGCLFSGVIFITQQKNVTKIDPTVSTVLVYPKESTIKVDGNYVRFTGLVQTENKQEEVVITHYIESEDEQKKWLQAPPNTWLLAHGEMAEPGPHTNFHQFNYQKYLKREKIHWVFRAENFEKVNDAALKRPFKYVVEHYRQVIFQYINCTFQPKIAAYLKILFFADNRDFSNVSLDSYRALGVVHLFSISGFHISYLSNALKRFFLRVGMTHERTNLMLLFLLPIYGFLSGFGISVFRAVTQQVFLLVSKQLKHEFDTFDAWALAMLLTLFINPYHVYSISFQLSYLLSGIFILMSKQKWIQRLNPFVYSLLFSFLSGIASLPIITYHFYEFPWVTMFANLLFIPFFSNLLFPSQLFLLIGSFSFYGMKLFGLFEQFLVLLIDFVENITYFLTSEIDFSIVTGRLPFLVMVLLTISIFTIIKYVEGKQRPPILPIVLMLLSMFYHAITPVGHVTMLDIGQGDSILLKAPFSRKATLIDTGGKNNWREIEEWMQREEPFSVGKDIIASSLKALGISEVERLYITHADADHSGEIESLGKVMPINEVAATRQTLEDEEIRNQLLALEDVRLVEIAPLELLNQPNEHTVAIHPTTFLQGESKNNQSLVLYVTIGNDKWLFTGDVEKDAERMLMEQYPNLQVDFLKVSHHGSQTSTSHEFLEHIQPRVALISAGKNNTFGHPHEEVLDNLRKSQVSTYVTSEEGAIMVAYFKVPFINHWATKIKTVHKTR